MKSTRWLLVLLAVVGLVAASCGDDDDDVTLGGADRSDEDNSDDEATDDTDEATDDTEDAVTDEAVTDEAVTDEAVTDEAVTDDAVTDETTDVIDDSESTTSVFDLEVGDCLNSDLLAGTVQDVGTIDCAAPHDFEIYHAFDLPDGDFPGDDVIGSEAQTECLGSAFTDFVGIEYNASTFYAQPLTPTVDSWAQGDREILCMLYATNDQGATVIPYTGSAAGTGL